MTLTPRVRTVLGDIPADELGFCSSHDHVLIGDGLGTRSNPDLRIDGIDEAVAEVQRFQQAGGNALVDAMPLDCGRQPAGLCTVSRRTGVHIVATTGFHTPFYYNPDHWSYSLPVDTVIELLVAEVVQGMDSHSYGSPVIERLEARAGLVKIATEKDRIAQITARLFEAVAACSMETGVPILTHTEHGTMGIEQVERFAALGVPPDRLLISHCDRNHDPAYHADLAASGAWLVYDGPSRTKYHTPEEVAKLIGVACEAGAETRILLGLDLALRPYRVSYGGSPGLAFLPGTFCRVLAGEGFSEVSIRQFGRENPSRALALRGS
jgi:predicted metal-dependent phosphotriesterase family hydrolase